MENIGPTDKPPDDYFKSTKVPLKGLLKNPEITLPIINKTANIANKIVIHTYQFIKLYSLDYYEKNNHTLPVIDKMFINCCMKILCKSPIQGKPPKKEVKDLKEKLAEFYESQYKPFIKYEELEYRYMNTILDYLTISILTMYENNIKMNFVEYIERYINVTFRKKLMLRLIRRMAKNKNESINNFNNQLRHIKIDILNVDNEVLKSKPIYHNWIKEQRKHIIPVKDFEKGSIKYDMKCSPQDYWPCMIYVMKKIELNGFTIKNVFPLRNNIITKHITLDTTTLVQLLMTKGKCDFLTKGNLKKNEDKIWGFFFKTEKKEFSKLHYSFHHMIETDGVSASIVLLRKDLVGKRFPKSKPGDNKELYINELNDYTSLQNKNIVAIDPGKSDLLYCVNGETQENDVFRYSQDQRRKEGKLKKIQNINLALQHKVINNKTVIDWQTNLSTFNCKTLQFSKFQEYIKMKSEINSKLFKFYNKFIFRKLKLNIYLNTKKSEQKMMNRFKKIFGNSDETIVCFGDFEQKRHMKYKEPVKGKGFRTLFRKSGYKTYLVDEHRTSCKCNNCHKGRCEKFLNRKNPKPSREELREVWGLLRCKICSSVWNRDRNGANNIYKISYNAIHKLDRPGYLRRGK